MTVQMMEAPSVEVPSVARIRRAHEGDIEVPLVEMAGRRAMTFFTDIPHAGEVMEAAEEYGARHGWQAVMVGPDALELVARFKGVEWAVLIDESDYMAGLVATVPRWVELISDPEA